MTLLHLIHKVILFAIEWVVGIVLAIVSTPFYPIIALFVNRDGNLPQPLRAIYQPADNPCWGDADWFTEHPHASKWWLSTTYLFRNNCYGYQSLVSCTLPKSVKVFGNTQISDSNAISGWYFILGDNGTFEFCFIYPLPSGKSCIRGEYGWSLKPIANHYEHPLLGSLQLVLLARFVKWGK